MKRFLFFIAACCLYSLQAQDIIVLYDKTELEAKVIEVRENEVLYKNWSNLEGPSYVIGKERIDYIKYINGTKESFYSNSKTTNQSENLPFVGEKKRNVFFNTYLELGLPFTYKAVGPSLQAVFGARINVLGFIGLGVGIDAVFSTEKMPITVAISNVPIMLNGRFFLLKRGKFHPFFDVSCGINVNFCSYGRVDFTDEYGQVTHSGNVVFKYLGVSPRLRILLGIEYKRFEMGFGYEFMALRSNSLPSSSNLLSELSYLIMGGNYGTGRFHFGYFKIGVRLGKMVYY